MTDELPPPSLARVITYLRVTLPATKLTPREQNIAWMVGSHYNAREGCARPSQARLAEESGRSIDVVYRALKAVTAAGIWSVEQSNARATRYRFPLAGVIHTPRETRGEVPAEFAGRSPRNSRGELLQGTGSKEHARAPAWCTPLCETCGGIGWIPLGPPEARMSGPCPERIGLAQ